MDRITDCAGVPSGLIEWLQRGLLGTTLCRCAAERFVSLGSYDWHTLGTWCGGNLVH